MKKVFETIKKILIGVVGTAYFLFALAMTILLLNYNDYGVTQFGNKSLIIMTDNVASESYKKGDLVIVEAKKAEQLEKGQEVFTYRIDSKGIPMIQIGKVGEVYVEDDAIAFENGETYSMEFVAGVGTKSYESLGTALSIIESQWGFLFIVLVPCFLIFIYEVYSLIVEIKYGGEED
ncbi:MAG: hypothetical protein IJA30_05230 [Bacilli bacterium]|nr:hypothetical protein [Bacilli bacterium]